MAARNVSYLHLRRTAQINDRFSMYRRPAFGIHTSGTRNRRPSNRSRFCPKSLPLGGRVSAQGSRRRRTSDDRVRQENSVTKRLPGRRLFTRFRLFAAPPERRQIDRQSRSTPRICSTVRATVPPSRLRTGCETRILATDKDGFDGTEAVHRNSFRYSFKRRYGAYFNGRSISLDERTTGRIWLKRSKLDRP